jgi:RNA polymerase sigma-70 factor (ECF subfamily)
LDGRDPLQENPLSDSTRDRTLVDAYLARRDEESFRALYRAHTDAVYRFAILRVGEQDAEDIVQETWIRAARGLATFAWRASLRTWLIGIALNLCREQYRRRGRLSVVPEPDAGRASSELVTASRAELREAIAAVPEHYREVLLLHDVEGYTHSEIATLLDMPPGTSKSQLHRARRALRDVFAAGARSHG